MAVPFGFLVDLMKPGEDLCRAYDQGITFCNIGDVVMSLSRRAPSAKCSDHLSVRGEFFDFVHAQGSQRTLNFDLQ